MHYSKITPDTTISELLKNESYGVFRDYIFTYMTPDHYSNKLSAYGYEKVGFEEGLHRMEELSAADGMHGESYLHNIYSEEDMMQSWDKAYAKYLHFPAKNSSGKPTPYVFIIPGGAFNRQWGFIEGEAIAAHLNNMGYSAFVLYYRVKQEPVVSLAIEDMICAIKDIETNAEKYNIIPGEYMIGGFSAGASLAGAIGTDNFGYKANSIPKPQAVFLGYAPVCSTEFYNTYKSLDENDPARCEVALFLRRLAGPAFNKESIEPFNLEAHIGPDYPKTYIVANEDDGTVSVNNSKYFDALLTKLNVEHITKIGKSGGHSFGLGNGLEVEGWLEEAVSFWRR